MNPHPLALALTCLTLFSPMALAEDAPQPISFGEPLGKHELIDIRYLPRTLSELGEAKAYVLYFATVECPLVQRYLPRLAKLERELADQGVSVVAVNVGPGDTIRAMATQALEVDAAFPFVKDYDARLAAQLGVTRSGAVVVLDGQQRLRYRGRIDDQYRLGGLRPQASRHDLREALADVLAGRKVRVEETPIDGCKLTPAQPRVRERAPTFAQDVAPIFWRSCVECHRPGTQAPFSLLSYERAKANGEMIAEVVRQGRMPPWFASDSHGSFSNQRALSSDEKGTIQAWVAAGCPSGDLKQLPAAPSFPDPEAWQIGEPDFVLPAPVEETLPAQGYVPYRYVVLPHVFAEDTWVSRVQIRPSNPRVVHHCNLAAFDFLDQDRRKVRFITGLVPGGSAMELPRGVAFKIPAGSMLVLQVHYVTTGKPEKDQISVGLRYPRERVIKQLHHVQVSANELAIPPFASAHPVKASRTLRHDATLIALFSHMHLRGKDMSFLAARPGQQERETLLMIPNYSFDWQLAYRLPAGKVRLPKGTRLSVEGHFDNSPFNPYNPDPKDRVRWGEQTYHEMFYGFVFYTDDDEQLDLRVDPQTGRGLPAAPQPEEQPKAPKRYF